MSLTIIASTHSPTLLTHDEVSIMSCCNKIGSAFRNHQDGGKYIARSDGRHDGSVDDRESLQCADTQLGVDHQLTC